MTVNDDYYKEPRFNLIEEPWIPVLGIGLVSLRQIFTSTETDAYRGLGGNPIQKIALMKLLLAIAQSACTPDDEQDWRKLGVQGLASACMSYLEIWHDAFFLYGEKPFLQVPAIKPALAALADKAEKAASIAKASAKAAKAAGGQRSGTAAKAATKAAKDAAEAAGGKSFGTPIAEIATGNTTVLTQYNAEKLFSDADKAMLLIQSMGFSLGGKKTENSVVLSDGYTGKTKDDGKPSSGKPGTNLGFNGFLHSFLLGKNIQETIWFNLFQRDHLEDLTQYPNGLGVAPWEDMPVGEVCASAERLKSSLMGRLLPVSRFMLLIENGLYYSEGIAHSGYMDGVVDPSVAVDFSAKKPKVLWVDPEKKPWRSLTSMLSFMGKGKFECYQLKYNLSRLSHDTKTVGIWSGGLRVSNNSGEQYVSGLNDYVDSVVFLNIDDLGDIWYSNLQNEMNQLDSLSEMVYVRVMGYFERQQTDKKKRTVKKQQTNAKDIPAQASNLFWQLCEPLFQDLVSACCDESSVHALRPDFARIVHQVYDFYCPKDTARQIDAWAKNKPDTRKYLNFNHGVSQ